MIAAIAREETASST